MGKLKSKAFALSIVLIVLLSMVLVACDKQDNRELELRLTTSQTTMVVGSQLSLQAKLIYKDNDNPVKFDNFKWTSQQDLAKIDISKDTTQALISLTQDCSITAYANHKGREYSQSVLIETVQAPLSVQFVNENSDILQLNPDNIDPNQVDKQTILIMNKIALAYNDSNKLKIVEQNSQYNQQYLVLDQHINYLIEQLFSQQFLEFAGYIPDDISRIDPELLKVDHIETILEETTINTSPTQFELEKLKYTLNALIGNKDDLVSQAVGAVVANIEQNIQEFELEHGTMITEYERYSLEQVAITAASWIKPYFEEYIDNAITQITDYIADHAQEQ
ncbi:MAG: hypothetical protein LBK70_00955 [Clostridiales bacterium]|jgi:hypothetical protein|nr:hypothetical protein [Clostridiales bacterium]